MISTLDRTDALIRDLLDLARTRNGALLPVVPADTRLGDVCAGVLAEVRDARPGAELSLSVTGDDRAAMDGGRMAQVVANLVANALEHGPGGGPVRVRVSGDAGQLLLEVENDGEAPEPEKLFEPFARGTHAGSGLGLGLFVVREVARAHGGTAALRSGDGRTIAEVRVPRAATIEPAAIATAPERSAR
jgi:signal transduction histidine kinase